MDWNIEVKDIITSLGNFYTISKDKIKIGRDPECDIPIDNKYISSHHLTLNRVDGGITIKDENSSNGTMLSIDGEWVELKGWKKVNLPVQVKLAGAVTLNLQSNVSMVYDLKELEQLEAIMVLDLCDSTKLSSLSNELAFHMKRRLSAISKPILYKNHINFFKDTGDGYLATFPGSGNALDASIKILKALDKRNKSTTNPPMHVRIALHLGKTYIIDPVTKDIHGNDTNITFRLEGVQKKSFVIVEQEFPEVDRIFCSAEFKEDLVKNHADEAKKIFFCGKAKLKGIKTQTEVYCIPWE